MDVHNYLNDRESLLKQKKTMKDNSSNLFTIISIVSAISSLFIFPIVFIPAAIICAVICSVRKEEYAVVAVIGAIVSAYLYYKFIIKFIS